MSHDSVVHADRRVEKQPASSSREELVPETTGDSGPESESVRKEQRVLVVEDNDALRTEIAELFRDYGYHVLEASDGSAALRLMRDEGPIDVVLLDLWMPRMDGWHFRLEQRRDPSLRDVPVVVLTADDSVQARTIDADAVIPKPFEAEELAATVSKVLSKQQTGDHAPPGFVRDSMELIAGAVGHEIANPLTVLIHSLEHARRTGHAIGAQQPGEASIDDLLDQCWRMVETIRSLRDLPPPKWHKAREVDVLRTAQTALSATVGDAGTIDHLPNVVLHVAGDSQVLHYVCRALLRNAIEAVPPAEEEQARPGARVVLTLRRQGREVVLDFHDQGPRIPEEDLPKVFSPDYFGRGSGWSGGIRLWFVREAVQAMGGAVEVFNDPSRGVHCRVRLPSL